MLSRVADAVYWTARYIERAESTARCIDVSLHMSLDAPITFSDQWEPLVAISGNRALFDETYGEASRNNVIQFLTFDTQNPNSILTCVTRARENARSIREVISSEMWEQINRFYLLVHSRARDKRLLDEDAYRFFADVRHMSHLIAGVGDNTMSHGQAWHFLQLGRLLERADNTTRLLDVKYFLLLPSVDDVGGLVDEMQWTVILRSATALEMYRKRFGRISPENVVDFLLLDSEFPRALLFCLMRAEESLRAISGTRAGTFQNAAEQRLGRMRSELAYMRVYDIIAAGLHEFLDGTQGNLNAVGDAITEAFFTLEPASSPAATGGRVSVDVLSGYQSQGRAGGDSGYPGGIGQ